MTFSHDEHTAAPCGSWPSPITAELLAAATTSVGQIQTDGDNVYVIESRPAEGGRNVIVRLDVAGNACDALPPPFSARTRAHEYGGGAYTVSAGTLFFVNDADQRVYRLDAGGVPRALTPARNWRYADLVVGPGGSLIAVCEAHGEGEPVASLVAIDAVSGETRTLVSGADFYASPRCSPDGRTLAWLSWQHPNMPWDGTQLWLAAWRADGALAPGERIAGGASESIFQPEFLPDGTLCFVSDRSGWWNLYRHDGDAVEALAAMEAEFGLPQWVFGMSTYAVVNPGMLVCAYARDGQWTLAELEIATRRLRPLALPWRDISGVRAAGERTLFVGGAPQSAPALVSLDLTTQRATVLRKSSSLVVAADMLSMAEPLTFVTSGGEQAHAFYYAPRNPHFRPPPGERPPLLVLTHGGPTAAASSTLNPRIQFWTSRGVAVLDVNYRGSSGYGRAYRERLNGAWGVADVEDCVAGARHLIARGLVDPQRVAIRGGSAGGYTTLSALVFHNVFRAGASFYGVSDLEALARDTHKFEKHYLDRLIGPYPASRDLYRARSPIHHVSGLRCPVIFFQGLEDKVVPPDQTERMVAALRSRGIPVASVLFADEAHGFRKAANIRRALEAELYFFGRIFSFTPADSLEPVTIENLP